jgi:beta-lactamase regulating signal transducer with metallopeptidase domain
MAILKLILAVLPDRLSRKRYNLLVASLFLLFGTVLGTFLLLYQPHMVKAIYPLQGKTASTLWKLEPNMLFTLCTYAYLAGMVFMLIRSLLSIRYLHKLRRSGNQVQELWLERMKKMADSLGIRRKLAFLESDQVSGPLLIGFLKPAVIVPVGMFTHLSTSQVETILIHELYHLKRLDYLVNLMQLFMEAILFYNPAIWYISDRIRREREYCCDDAVVQISKDPFNYAKALVSLAEQGAKFRLAPGAGGSNRNHFTTRIGRIIKSNTMKKKRQEKVMPFLLMAASILVIVLASGFGSGFSITKQIDERPLVEAEPVRKLSPDLSPAMQDTIKNPKAQKDKPEEAEKEAARKEALEEIDWDRIREDMEAARKEALEEIDWDRIREDMEAARKEALEEIDWDRIREDMEAAKIDALSDLDFDLDFDFDMEAFKEDFEQARKEMEEIDWEEIKEEMERSFSEIQIDVEELKRNMQESLKDIDWDEMHIEIENSRRDMDSPSIEKEN